jgi:hypothetical protein
MVCDYIVESYLVIEYINDKKQICKVTTNCKRECCYLDEMPEYKLHDDENIKIERRNSYLNQKIQEKTRKKILFENDNWVKNSYKKHYKKGCYFNYINSYKLIKVYKDFKAIERTTIYFS